MRLIVLLVALAGFAYLSYRLIRSWGRWPEDMWSAGLRIAELGLVGVFVLWALACVLWPKGFTKVAAEEDQGRDAEP